jgi:post-segregation antitoxin (ccd killing protein)
MTEVVVKLPDDLAQRAKNAGLLSDSAIQRLLEEAMRREAGRRLLEVAERLHAAGVEPMSEEEIAAEVEAVRAERRARQAKPDPKRS